MTIAHRNERFRKPVASRAQVEILKGQNGTCFYCGTTFGEIFPYRNHYVCARLEWDHLLAFAFCRNNCDKNMVAACEQCNRIKSDRVFDSIEEAIRYVRQRRKDKGLPLFKLRARVSAKKGLAKVSQQQMPDGLLLENPRDCAYCGVQFYRSQTHTRMCCAECCKQPEDLILPPERPLSKPRCATTNNSARGTCYIIGRGTSSLLESPGPFLNKHQ